MAVWQEKRLGDIISIKHGFAFKGEYISDEANGKVLVTPGNFHIGGGFKKTDKKFYHGEIPLDFILKPKDIIITMTDLSKNADTIGYSALTPNDNNIYLHNQRIGLVSVLDSNIDKHFIYWLLRTSSYQRQIANTSNGTNVKHTSPNRIYSYKCSIPDLATQEKIADILSTYDDLIENNNRRIEMLEQMAQEIYKEWFIRFRFPEHEKVKFVNGLPEGWEVKKIGDIASLKSGYAFKSSWWQEEGIPVIKIKDIQNNGIDTNNFAYVSEIHMEKAKQFIAEPGDIVIALTGATIGKIGLIPFYHKPLLINQRVGKFFCGEKPILNNGYLYILLQQNWIKDLIFMISSSSAAQPNISPNDIEEIKILYNKNIIEQFNQKISDYILQILKLKNINKNLIKQRDLLLPRLMSGKLEV